MLKMIRGYKVDLWPVIPLAQNRRVKYESREKDGRWHQGRVHSYDAVDAIIRHDTEPYLVTVRRSRLVEMPIARSRFAGGAA